MSIERFQYGQDEGLAEKARKLGKRLLFICVALGTIGIAVYALA